jgi:hypothetical protein
MCHINTEHTPDSVYTQALNGAYKKKGKNVLIRCMDDLADKRRKILAGLITDKVTLADVGRMFGKPDRQIKDMIESRKSFGGKVARAMEDFAIKAGHTAIYPYFFDGLKEAEAPPKEKLMIAGVEIDTYEQQLLKIFGKLKEAHKDAILMLANKLYETDNPGDNAANPWKGVYNRRKSDINYIGNKNDNGEKRSTKNHAIKDKANNSNQ